MQTDIKVADRRILVQELVRHGTSDEGIRGSLDIDFILSLAKVLVFIADRTWKLMRAFLQCRIFLAFCRFPFQSFHSVIINNPLALLRV